MDDPQVERILQIQSFKKWSAKTHTELDINSNHVVYLCRFYAFSWL